MPTNETRPARLRNLMAAIKTYQADRNAPQFGLSMLLAASLDLAADRGRVRFNHPIAVKALRHVAR